MKKFAFVVALCLLCIVNANARVLKKGLKGDDVKQWQLFLVKRGLMEPPALGNFSDRTEKATLAFQKKYGIAEKGIVGPKTVKKAVSFGFKPTSDKAAPKSEPKPKKAPPASSSLAGFPYRGMWTARIPTFEGEVALQVTKDGQVKCNLDSGRRMTYSVQGGKLIIVIYGQLGQKNSTKPTEMVRFTPRANGEKMQASQTYFVRKWLQAGEYVMTRQWAE